MPKIEPKPGVHHEEAPGHGVASQQQSNIYGPPLNTMGEEELLHKLVDLRNKDFDAESVHSVMQKNLEKIEEREGEISDEKMAAYIYNTFGEGAN